MSLSCAALFDGGLSWLAVLTWSPGGSARTKTPRRETGTGASHGALEVTVGSVSALVDQILTTACDVISDGAYRSTQLQDGSEP